MNYQPMDPGAGRPEPGKRYDVPQDIKNLALISTIGMVLVGFLSPLIVYIVTADEPRKAFARDHAREGLNFSIVFFGGLLVATVLSIVLIGVLLYPVLIVWGIWVVIAGAIQANNGQAPNYPLVPAILK